MDLALLSAQLREELGLSVEETTAFEKGLQSGTGIACIKAGAVLVHGPPETKAARRATLLYVLAESEWMEDMKNPAAGAKVRLL